MEFRSNAAKFLVSQFCAMFRFSVKNNLNLFTEVAYRIQLPTNFWRFTLQSTILFSWIFMYQTCSISTPSPHTHTHTLLQYKELDLLQSPEHLTVFATIEDLVHVHVEPGTIKNTVCYNYSKVHLSKLLDPKINSTI